MTSSYINKLTNWFRKRSQGQRIMQWISYVMIFLMLIVFILEFPVVKPNWRFDVGVLILAMLLVINILWDQSHEQITASRHAWGYRWAFIIISNVLVLGGIALTGQGEMIFLVFMQTAQFAIFSGVWPNGVFFAAINLAIITGILAAYGSSTGSLIQAGSQFMVGMVFVLVFVSLVNRSTRETKRAEGLLKDLQAANLALKAAHQREKELAIADERMRLARDIHDGLGHHLTVLSIQLQAAEKLVERNPKSALEAIRVSRSETQAALEEVRRSVGVMRQPPPESQPLVDMIANLVHDFAGHTGLQSNFEHTGTPIELSYFTGQTLYRTVQESLTNIQKHAIGVEQIRVKLEYSAETIRLTVSDDGKQSKDIPSIQGGYGLKGLRERVEQLGGELFCGPGSSGGFQVDVNIPLQEVIGDQSTPGG